MGEIEHATTEELEAALQARKELGKDYEAALVESFVSKIDDQIEARVDAGVAERLRNLRAVDGKVGERQMILGFVSLGTGIPITAIAQNEGLAGMLVAWAGIGLVNLAHAWSSRRENWSAPGREAS